MKIQEKNNLYYAIGAFAGLADDDEAMDRFRNFDYENDKALVEVIRELQLPEFLKLQPEQQRAGMDVLSRVTDGSFGDVIGLWYSILPPFPYPSRINLFRLIYDTLASEVAPT